LDKKIKNKLQLLKTGLSLSDLMPFGKYGKRYCIEWVIQNDIAYMNWCIEESVIKLDKEAEKEFIYAYEVYIEHKNNTFDFLTDKGFI